MSVFEKNMEFSLLVGEMTFFVFCKFEIDIFKIVQVMTENIPFAFLYVLRILYDDIQWRRDAQLSITDLDSFDR